MVGLQHEGRLSICNFMGGACSCRAAGARLQRGSVQQVWGGTDDCRRTSLAQREPCVLTCDSTML